MAYSHAIQLPTACKRVVVQNKESFLSLHPFFPLAEARIASCGYSAASK